MANRGFVVSRSRHGQTIATLLRESLGFSWSEAKRAIQDGKVIVAGKTCLDPTRRASTGQRIEVRSPDTSRKHSSNFEPFIRYADAHLVVVEKPSGLTTMRHPEEAAEFGARARHYLPPTLADMLPGLIRDSDKATRARSVIPVHRIDKETSGLVVFARTPESARHLGKQFREHTIERYYLALVRGHAKEGRIESWLVRDRGDGRRGSGNKAKGAQHAITHVKIAEPLGDYTLVECRLETGRTHQVRIHLGEAGTPLCGEHLYDRPTHGKPLPDNSGAKRITLHAAFLALDHPLTGKRMKWSSALPSDMDTLVKRLRSMTKPKE